MTTTACYLDPYFTVNAQTLKQDITSRLHDAIRSKELFEKEASFLQILGVPLRDNSIDLGELLESVTGNYLDSICKRLTAHFAEGTPAKISIDRDLYILISLRGSDEHRELQSQVRNRLNTFESDIKVSDSYLEAIEFKTIAESINTQRENLKNTGLSILAASICTHLHFEHLDGHNKPYLKHGKLVVNTWAFNHYRAYEVVKDLTGVALALKAVEKESDMVFGSAMDDYIAAAQQLSYQGHEKIPSRTVFGKGSHLEIHIFKEKHEFRLSMEAFEAILAFLSLNGKEAVVTQIMEKTKLLEAA